MTKHTRLQLRAAAPRNNRRSALAYHNGEARDVPPLAYFQSDFVARCFRLSPHLSALVASLAFAEAAR